VNRANGPTVTRPLRVFTLIEVAVVGVAAFALLVLPEFAAGEWPWELTPFNTTFLGGVYLSAWIPLVLLALQPRWSPARLVVTMIFTFTLVVLVASLWHADRFDWERWSNAVWWPLYVALPINSAIHLWLYRRLRPAAATPTGRAWRAVLLGLAAVLGAYGAWQLVAPESASAWWPWPVDDFHGRVYSAAFFTGMAACLVVAREASPLERGAVALMIATLAVVAAAGIAVRDASLDRIDWSAPGAIAWCAAWAALLALGLALSSPLSSRARRSSPRRRRSAP
jgi:hypothetical protein